MADLVSSQNSTAAGFDDILKYGVLRYIDSELANPPAPAPQNTNEPASIQTQTTATGTGTTTKESGTLPITAGIDNRILIGGGLFVAALIAIVLVSR